MMKRAPSMTTVRTLVIMIASYLATAAAMLGQSALAGNPPFT